MAPKYSQIKHYFMCYFILSRLIAVFKYFIYLKLQFLNKCRIVIGPLFRYASLMFFRLLFCFLLFSHISVAKEYVIGINERDIFRYKDAQGQWQGKDIDLIRAVFDKTPHTFKLVSMPWARVLQDIKSGRVDLTLAAANLPERADYAYFSSNVFRYSYYTLFVRKDRIEQFGSVTALAELAEKNVFIGALRDAVYSENYLHLLKNSQLSERIVFIDNDQSLPNFALKGRVDGYIESELEGLHYLNQAQSYRDNIVPLFRMDMGKQSASFLMFSKKTVTQKELKTFDEALAQIWQQGDYWRISEKYQVNLATKKKQKRLLKEIK